MKKFFGVSLLLFLVLNATSQSKGIELIDFLSAASIPKTETANSLPWQSVPSQTVKWKEKAPVKVGTLSQQSGAAMVMIDGKKFICEDEIAGKKMECTWNVTFQGKPNGYDRFAVSTTNFPVQQPGSEIKLLFPKHGQYFKLISKCIDGASYWVNLYEVRIPGRKMFWMLSTFESMSATASQYENSGVANMFNLGFYFSRKMAEDNCTN